MQNLFYPHLSFLILVKKELGLSRTLTAHISPLQELKTVG